MSIQEERELRGLLGGLMDGVEPGPAPVALTVRRGRGIRMRKWATAAAGVAVLAAGAVVVLPVLQAHHPASSIAPTQYRVTMQALGPVAKDGVIGAGTIDNKRWRVVVTKTPGGGCTVDEYELMCGAAYGTAQGPRDVSLESASANDTQFQIGTVGADVTRVVIQLSNGTELNLRPITASGQRWIAVAAPLHTMIGAVSFVAGSAYLRAVPYVTSHDTEFVTWLSPGQAGLPRTEAQVGSGEIDGVTWRASVSVGPWGYCVTFANGGSCIPTAGAAELARIGRPLSGLACGPLYTRSGKPTGASAGVMALPRGVKNVVLKFADGSHLRLVAVFVGGTRVLGYGIPGGPKIVRTLEYGFAGQLVGTTSGSGWRC